MMVITPRSDCGQQEMKRIILWLWLG